MVLALFGVSLALAWLVGVLSVVVSIRAFLSRSPPSLSISSLMSRPSSWPTVVSSLFLKASILMILVLVMSLMMGVKSSMKRGFMVVKGITW